jgi:hypothetical protein
MMRMFNDGSVAVTIEYEHATLRVHDHVPSSGRPPYVCVGQLARLPNGLVFLSGFCGEIRAPHYRLILSALVSEGFKTVIMERAAGRSAPLAERVVEGDFAGLWRIDLTRMEGQSVAQKDLP